MESATTVEHESPAEVIDLSLVALTPSDMAPVQKELDDWCDRKIVSIRIELDELKDNLRVATESKWRTSGLSAAVRRTEKRIAYYEKIQAAVKAGYLIVPNFPVDLFAVRVKRAKQAQQTSDYRQTFGAKAELLPAGEGRYVDDTLAYYTEEYDGNDRDGKAIVKSRNVSGDFEAMDFPVTLVKPEVLRATQRALALRVFDEVGVVQNRTGKDPIVVGRLLDPRGNGRLCTFFIAWWLDTRDL